MDGICLCRVCLTFVHVRCCISNARAARQVCYAGLSSRSTTATALESRRSSDRAASQRRNNMLTWSTHKDDDDETYTSPKNHTYTTLIQHVGRYTSIVKIILYRCIELRLLMENQQRVETSRNVGIDVSSGMMVERMRNK